jgi:hypothetical protein
LRVGKEIAQRMGGEHHSQYETCQHCQHIGRADAPYSFEGKDSDVGCLDVVVECEESANDEEPCDKESAIDKEYRVAGGEAQMVAEYAEGKNVPYKSEAVAL